MKLELWVWVDGVGDILEKEIILNENQFNEFKKIFGVGNNQYRFYIEDDDWEFLTSIGFTNLQHDKDLYYLELK